MSDPAPFLSGTFSCFAAATPGIEPVLAREMSALGLKEIAASPGGVAFAADFEDLMRAHLWLRTASRILVRIGEARLTHLAQLDKWARKLPWKALLPFGAPLSVDASAKRSKLYHTGAISQRVETAARAALGPERAGAPAARLFVRLEKDQCSVSLDASGEPLHKRGHKLETGKAPLRETLAAAFLAECGYSGDEPLIDPMCGSGTFVLEAAALAAGLPPGRDRDFAFKALPGFDNQRWTSLLEQEGRTARAAPTVCFGFDRDAGAVAVARANAERAGLSERTRFEQQTVSDLTRPDGPPGLVVVNPPYGERIGDRKRLAALYGSLGGALKDRFQGWRVGLVTSAPDLAKAAGLPFGPPGPPIPHGPLKIRLYRAALSAR